MINLFMMFIGWKWLIYFCTLLVGLMMIYVKQQTYLVRKNMLKIAYENKNIKNINQILLTQHIFLHNAANMEKFMDQLKHYEKVTNKHWINIY